MRRALSRRRCASSVGSSVKPIAWIGAGAVKSKSILEGLQGPLDGVLSGADRPFHARTPLGYALDHDNRSISGQALMAILVGRASRRPAVLHHVIFGHRFPLAIGSMPR